MGVKVLFVAGVPASGKTTLFKRIREALFVDSTEFKNGKVRGIESADRKYQMLGVFDGSTFEGTDRLSMTVIDDAIKHIQQLGTEPIPRVVFVEGDRLFNYRFLSETCANVIVIDAFDEVLAKRHEQRGDNQSETFLKSRRTKIENMMMKYNIPKTWNNTIDDSTRLLQYVISLSKQWIIELKNI